MKLSKRCSVRHVVNTQFFASIDDIISGNAEAFGEGDTTKETFEGLSSRLKDMGYEMLINKRDAAEFVPASRLSDVVSQREGFKNLANNLQSQLNELKTKAEGSPELQSTINELMSSNNELMNQLQEASMQVEIMSNASDAINPKDVIPFVDRSKITTDKKTGKITGGLAEEIQRIRTEKPYLFNSAQTAGDTKPRAGFDGVGAQAGSKPNMNSAIRRAAFGSHTF